MNYIILSNEPSTYGSECSDDELQRINGVLEAAADAAGIEYVYGRAGVDQTLDHEIDWFRWYCESPYRADWVSLFKHEISYLQMA